MTCNEVQGYITPFINDELDYNQLEKFLDHIENCTECKEELEVYYTLLTGMKQLDEEQNLPSDFHIAFINKLRKEEEYIVHKKILSIRKRITLIIVICVFSMASSLGIGEYVVEDIINNEEQEERSEYIIRNYYFEDKITTLDLFINENKVDIFNYKKQLENKNKLIDKGDYNE